MTPEEHQATHIQLHRALDELLSCYLGENLGAPGNTPVHRVGINTPLLHLLEWAHQKSMLPSSCERPDCHPRSTIDFESQRQLIVLALAELALTRPGFEFAIKEILRFYDDSDLSLFEKFKISSAGRGVHVL